MGDLIVWLFFGSFIGAAVLSLQYVWPLIVFIAVVYVGLRLLLRSGRKSAQAAQRRHEANAAIAARADKQHHQIMSGDEVNGTYGDYLPPKGLRRPW